MKHGRTYRQIAITFFAITFYLGLQPSFFSVKGISMVPSIIHGDVLFAVNRVMFVRLKPDYEDIISVDRGEISVLKRVIGKPGDRIQIQLGCVFRNFEMLEELYVDEMHTSGKVDVLLKENEYFIIGDNRDVSLDSRRHGPINFDDIEGIVVFRLSCFR